MRQLLRKYFQGDMVIWIVITVLFIFSLLAVYSASGSLAYKYMAGNTTYYLLKHFLFLAAGVAIVYFTHRIPYKYFSKLSQILLYVSIPLLFVTLIAGTTRNEASRWLEVPGIGVAFQTSDLAKFALIMYIARILSQNQKNDDELKLAFKKIIIAVVAICGLILPANFSTAALLFATSWMLMYIGRVNRRYLLNSLGAIAIVFALFIMVAAFSPSGSRIETWKNRIVSFASEDNSQTTKRGNYQVAQAKIAIVTGGLVGKGPGGSTQRNFLPHSYSDFIYAIIIEEYGIIGGIVILFLYLFLLYRACLIVSKTKRTFPAFLAIGLTINLVFQALTNMAVAVNLIPVTGQTLPMVSMGGTSIIFTSVALGIILSVSRSTQTIKQPTK